MWLKRFSITVLFTLIIPNVSLAHWNVPNDGSASPNAAHGPLENPFSCLPTKLDDDAKNGTWPDMVAEYPEGYPEDDDDRKRCTDNGMIGDDITNLYEQSVYDPKNDGLDNYKNKSIGLYARTCIGVPLGPLCGGGYIETKKILSAWGECSYMDIGIRFCARFAESGKYGNKTDTQPDYRIEGNSEYILYNPDTGEYSGQTVERTLDDGTTVKIESKIYTRRAIDKDDMDDDKSDAEQAWVDVNLKDYHDGAPDKVIKYSISKVTKSGGDALPDGTYTLQGTETNKTLQVKNGMVVTPRQQICAYEDPKDGADSSGGAGDAGFMPYHENVKVEDTTASDDAYNTAVTLAVAGGIVAVGSALILAPAYIALGLAALGSWIASEILSVYNDIVYQNEGCIDVEAGPSPQPFCDTLSAPKPTPSVERICSTGQTMMNGCVESLDGIPNTFQEPRVRVGFNKYIPVCRLEQTSTDTAPCITLLEVTGKPAFLQQCTGGGVQKNCFEISNRSYATKVRVVYKGVDPISKKAILSGINVGEFADLTYLYPNNNGQTSIPDTQINPLQRFFYISMNDPQQVCVKESGQNGDEDKVIDCVSRLPMPMPVIFPLPECPIDGRPDQQIDTSNCTSNTNPLVKVALSKDKTASGLEEQYIILGAKAANKCQSLYGKQLCSQVTGELARYDNSVNPPQYLGGLELDSLNNYVRGGQKICVAYAGAKDFVLTRMKNTKTNEYVYTKDARSYQNEEVASLDKEDTLMADYIPGAPIQYSLRNANNDPVYHLPTEKEAMLGKTPNKINTTSECKIDSKGARICIGEGLRAKQPVELGLCADIPQVEPCSPLTIADAGTGHATWPATDPGQTAEGTCAASYGNQGSGKKPKRFCELYKDGTRGKWSVNIENACTRNTCPSKEVSFTIRKKPGAVDLFDKYEGSCTMPAKESGTEAVMGYCSADADSDITKKFSGSCYQMEYNFGWVCQDLGPDMQARWENQTGESDYYLVAPTDCDY